jgi:hypothetical protein
MEHQFVITIDDQVFKEFAINFLKKVSFIKSIKFRNEKSEKVLNVDEVTLISQEALAEDWLSEDDNRWDNLL